MYFKSKEVTLAELGEESEETRAFTGVYILVGRLIDQSWLFERKEFNRVECSFLDRSPVCEKGRGFVPDGR